MSNTAIIKREAREAIKELERSLQNYVDKNPDKQYSAYVKKQNDNINSIKLLYNTFEQTEQTNSIYISKLKQRIDKLEKTVVMIVDSLILFDFNVAFHALTCILEYTPDTLSKMANLRNDVLKKFDIKRFFNVLEKNINS